MALPLPERARAPWAAAQRGGELDAVGRTARVSLDQAPLANTLSPLALGLDKRITPERQRKERWRTTELTRRSGNGN
jgi:hypothetical protein